VGVHRGQKQAAKLRLYDDSLYGSSGPASRARMPWCSATYEATIHRDKNRIHDACEYRVISVGRDHGLINISPSARCEIARTTQGTSTAIQRARKPECQTANAKSEKTARSHRNGSKRLETGAHRAAVLLLRTPELLRPLPQHVPAPLHQHGVRGDDVPAHRAGHILMRP
jgi:hypothetical protein